MDSIVYLDGRYLPAEQARVPIFDHGFLYGDGVFETVRAYGGVVFAAEDHFKRLEASAHGIGIPLPFALAGFQNILDGCLSRNKMTEAIVRLSISRGVGDPWPAAPVPGIPTVSAFTRPCPQVSATDWASGIAVQVSDITATPSTAIPSGIKSCNFLSHGLALRAARAEGASEAILLNDRGEVAEGTVSNLFGVWNGVLITPPESADILPGITRRNVLELARETELEVQQKPIPAKRLARADELFVTNSGWEIMPVTTVDGKPVGQGAAGPVTTALHKAYKARVQATVKGSKMGSYAAGETA